MTWRGARNSGGVWMPTASPYKVKVKDRSSPWFSLWGGRERTGVFFQNASLDRQYVIYVSRENLSLAQAVTGLEAKR